MNVSPLQTRDLQRKASKASRYYTTKAASANKLFSTFLNQALLFSFFSLILQVAATR